MSSWDESLHPRGKGPHGGEWIKKLDGKISADLGENKAKAPRPKVILSPKISQIETGDKVRVKGWSKSVPVTGKSGDGVITPNGTVHIAKIDKVFPHDGGVPAKPVAASPPQKWIDKVNNKISGDVKEPKAAPKPEDSKQRLDAIIKHQHGIIPVVVNNTTISYRPPKHADLGGGKSGGNVDAINKAANGKAHIYLNTNLAKQSSREQYNATLSGHRSKSNAKTPLEHTTAHELGHSLDHIVGKAKMSDALDAVAKVLGIEPQRRRKAGSLPYSQREMDVWVQKNNAKLRKAVSGYGTMDAGELFAEIWAEYSLGTSAKPPRPAAQAAGKIMHDAANGKLT